MRADCAIFDKHKLPSCVTFLMDAHLPLQIFELCHSSLSWPLNRLFAHAVLTVNQLNVKEKFTKLGTDCCAPARKFTSICYVTICLFSLSFSIHFLRCWQTEFGWHSTALNGDHILYSRDQNTWFRVDIVGRNYMLVTQGGGQRFKCFLILLQ